MITVEICMGSSCFLRGSAEAVKVLDSLITSRGLNRNIVIKGSFCMEKCTQGITLKINGETISGVNPQDIESIFEQKILALLR